MKTAQISTSAIFAIGKTKNLKIAIDTKAVQILVAVILAFFCSISACGQRATAKDMAHCQSQLEKENPLETEHLSSADRSDLEFCRISDTLDGVTTRLSFHDRKYDFWKAFRNETVPLWFDLRDTYCEFHPAAQYVDVFNNIEHCPVQSPVIHTSKGELEKLFSESETGNFNMEMAIQEQNCNGDRDCLQKQVNSFKSLVKPDGRQ